MEKKCSKCKRIKNISLFSKTSKTRYHSHCKKCSALRMKELRKTPEEKIKQSIRNKKYREENKELLEEKRIIYIKNNKEKIKKSQRKYNREHRKARVKKSIEYRKERCKIDFKFKMNCNMSNQISNALKKNKNGYMWEILIGYTLRDLMNHFESLFTEGMSFDNYGEWEVDHKKPKFLFNYTSSEDSDFKECWALENLQPLWKEENQSKGSKYIEE